METRTVNLGFVMTDGSPISVSAMLERYNDGKVYVHAEYVTNNVWRTGWAQVHETQNVVEATQQVFSLSHMYEQCLSNPNGRRPGPDKIGDICYALKNLVPNHEEELKQAFEELTSSKEDFMSMIKVLQHENEELKKKAEGDDINSLIQKAIVDAATPEIRKKVRESLGSFIDAVPTRIEVKINDALKKPAGEAVRHRNFEKVLKFIAAGQPVWLFGEAGTGKSQLCEQVAEALEAKYRCINSVMDEWAGLKGFIDANGRKHGTQFTEALDLAKMGVDVVLCIDEADNSIPEVFLVLNSLLSGGTIECMGECYKMNDHLHIVACGNTAGRGGSNAYTRSIIDQATLDRFTFVDVDYDEGIELNVAGGNEDLARFCREVRNAARNCGIDLLVTYRGIKRMRENIELVGLPDAIRYGLIRGLDEADMRTLINELKDKVDNKFIKAMKK